MMWSKMKANEKRLFSAAMVCCFVFAFLLVNDSWLDWDSGTNKLRQVGVVTEKSNDVRQKIAKQYVWKNTKNHSKIHQGDSLFTGPGSESRVELFDGSQIVVRENSLIVFNFSENELNMNFAFGSAYGFTGSNKMKLEDCGKKIELSGQNGQFELQKTQTCGGLKLKVLSGQVNVNGTTLNKNQFATIQAGQKPKAISLSAKDKYRKPASNPFAAANTTAQDLENSRKDAEARAAKKLAEEQAALLAKYPGLDQIAPLFVTPNTNYIHFVQLDSSGNNRSPRNFKMKWSYPRDGLNYELSFSQDPEFTNQVGQYRLNSLESTTPILPNGKYFARVRAASPDHKLKSPWSKALAFEVTNEKPVTKLDPPKLAQKSMDFKSSNSNPIPFAWNKVNGAHHYRFEFSDNPNFSNSKNYETTSNSKKLKKFGNGLQFYRVYAVAADGTQSLPSETGQVTVHFEKPVIESVNSVKLEAKTENEVPPAQNFALKWQGPPADSYLVQVATSNSFENAIQVNSEDLNKNVQIQKPGHYFWRVQAQDSKNKAVTDFSSVGEFNYDFKLALVTPVLKEPAKDTTIFFQSTESPSFWTEWNPVASAEKYIIQISKEPDFSDILLTKELKTNRYLVHQSKTQGKIYWRVRAIGVNKESSWSEARRISVFAGKTANSNANQGE